MKKRICWLGWVLLITVTLSSPLIASTLEQVKQRGSLRCGVNTGLPGLSQADENGQWKGLDVDTCRAVAAAVLGDADKVEFIPLTNKERLEAVREGSVDLLSRNTTWTLLRDTTLGVDFVGVNYYDGQGFLAKKADGYRSALELDGVSVCVPTHSTSETNLKHYFNLHRMKLRAVPVESAAEGGKAFSDGRCDVVTSDQSQLYGLRSTLPDREMAVILPEVISKEPLGPVVREGDANWADIVRWSLFTLIDAEELGVNSGNVERIRAEAKNPDIRRLLDLDGESGKALGLDPEWGYRIIKQVGNYAESFERNLGKGSPLKIRRGLNALWRDGGLMYAPPVR